MYTTRIIIYIIAILLSAYSVRSLIAGIGNESRSYWMTTRFDGTKEWLKEDYNRVWNIICGIIGIASGIILFYLY